MNWAALVQNTGPYPEENLWGSMKIVLCLGLAAWWCLVLLRRWARAEKKTSVAERAGLVKPPKSKSYEKLNGATYRILDLEEYDRFWWGRAPSSRELFEAWLKVPTASMRAVSMRQGKRSTAAILRLVKMLKVRGILRREGPGS